MPSGGKAHYSDLILHSWLDPLILDLHTYVMQGVPPQLSLLGGGTS
jgi:hypothetical protein